jgi:hypothetical protein
MVRRVAIFLCAALIAISGVAAAATEVPRVSAKRDWAVFQADENGGKVCWIVTKPVTWKAFKGSTETTDQVRRGDIFLMVSMRPKENVKFEVSVMSGYPYRKGGEVTAQIGADNFTLFSEGESAWLTNGSTDEAMVAAMKRGRTAKVTGFSQRGTKTVDEFSLLGFTAALQAAEGLRK